MDEHALRVLNPVLVALSGVQSGALSVRDLQASVSGAAGALDNAHAAVRVALERLDGDLELIRFTVSRAEQAHAVQVKAADLVDLIGEL